MATKRNILVSVLFRIAVISVLLLVAISVFIALKYTAPTPAEADVSSRTPRIQVMEAQPVPVRRQWEGFGTASAMEAANVPSRVTATVVERPENVRPGQRVEQGQLLVRLDESDFARQVEIATQAIADIDAQLNRLAVEEQSWTRRAELAAEDVQLARAEYERVQQAIARDAARQRELDAAQRAVVTAQQAEVAVREELDKIAPRRSSLLAQQEREQASLRLARLNLERSRIVSPISGVLAAVDVEVGENIAAGQRIARVVNLQRIEIPLLLPASARPFVSIGDTVQLSDTGAIERVWQAHVSRISPVDDEATRTMRIFAEVGQASDDPNLLPPGRFVRGVVQSGAAEMRWVVPRRALTSDRIILIEDGRVRMRNVEIDFNVQADLPSLGLPDQQWVVLKKPLPEKSLVVVDGSRTLAEGAEVIPIVGGMTTAIWHFDDLSNWSHTINEHCSASRTPLSDIASVSHAARTTLNARGWS